VQVTHSANTYFTGYLLNNELSVWNYWGEPERAPHSRVLKMSVRLSGG